MNTRKLTAITGICASLTGLGLLFTNAGYVPKHEFTSNLPSLSIDQDGNFTDIDLNDKSIKSVSHYSNGCNAYYHQDSSVQISCPGVILGSTEDDVGEEIWGLKDHVFPEDIRAGNGDDLIKSFKGNDLIYGGNGNDQIFPGEGEDEVHAGPGDDKITLTGGSDRVFGDDGNDTYIITNMVASKEPSSIVDRSGSNTVRCEPEFSVKLNQSNAANMNITLPSGKIIQLNGSKENFRFHSSCKVQ